MTTTQLVPKFEIWSQERGPTLSASSARKYRGHVKEFLKTLPTPPTQATPSELREWYHTITTFTRSGVTHTTKPSTLNVKLAAVRAFYAFLKEEGLRKDDPTTDLAMATVAKREPRNIAQADLDAIFKAVYAPSDDPLILQDRAMLEVLYGSGLRRHEAAQLRPRNIIDRGKMRVIGKGNKERTTIITEPEYKALRDWCVSFHGDERTAQLVAEIDADAAFTDWRKRYPETPIFVTANGPPVEELADPGNYIWQRVRHYARVAGVQVTPHQFRHSWATDLLDEGADLTAVGSAGGWSSLEVLKGYRGIGDKTLSNLRNTHPRVGV
jgi:site-specific recombinase XerD